MARTFVRQETQIRNSDSYDDTVTPSLANFETNPTNIEGDLNNLRSAHKNLKGTTNWYDTPTRSVETIVTDLADMEDKRLICPVQVLTNCAIASAGHQYDVLLVSGSEAPTSQAAVGAGTGLGAIVALLAGASGTASLNEVAGSNALSPKNLVLIRDAATKEAIMSSNGREIFGLLQAESIVVNGDAFDDTTKQVQISFVENNGSDDLALVTAGDMDGKSYEYQYPKRITLDTLTEDCTWPPRFSDQVASTDVTRQNSYNGQGTTPVELANNADLDLAASVEWALRDAANADVFKVVEGSAGSATTVLVGADADVFDVNAASNDFLQGVTMDSGGTAIDIGVTTVGNMTSAGLLRLVSGGGADLSLVAASELNMTDSYRAGSTWSLADGISLADSSSEWSAFETAFGEVSLLSAITAAYNVVGTVTKTCANVTQTEVANTDIGGTSGGANLDAQLHDLSGGTFVDNHDIFLNGNLLRSGANAAANNDVYPGTSLALGQLKFEFAIKINDVVCVISRA